MTTYSLTKSGRKRLRKLLSPRRVAELQCVRKWVEFAKIVRAMDKSVLFKLPEYDENLREIYADEIAELNRAEAARFEESRKNAVTKLAYALRTFSMRQKLLLERRILFLQISYLTAEKKILNLERAEFGLSAGHDQSGLHGGVGQRKGETQAKEEAPPQEALDLLAAKGGFKSEREPETEPQEKEAA